MHEDFKNETWTTYNLNSLKLNSQLLFFTSIKFLSKFHGIQRDLSPFWLRSFLSRQIFLGFSFGLLLMTSYTSHALASKTSNIINGNPPYLTFDGGRTRATDTEDLLGIYLSNGDKFTPTTNSSSLTEPIELPEVGQGFADIDMFVPTNTNYIALKALIDPPYNYWGDDDGDGDGANGIYANGNLRLLIADKDNRVVTRNQELSICRAPYKLTLSYSGGKLVTRYGVPRETLFSSGSTIYYIIPKVVSPMLCFAKPNLEYGSPNDFNHREFAGPASIWDYRNGFLIQSSVPSSYHLNFPTTGANNLYFDLYIGRVNQALFWAPVSRDGITATMTNSTNTSVRVTLTGPVATQSQWNSSNPGSISKPSLPQIFELVGRDNDGNAVVNYGFVLKQWYVNSPRYLTYSLTSSWCDNIGYRLPTVSDLTNATVQDFVGAMPSSPGNYYQRRIAAGLFTEWGRMDQYKSANFAGGLEDRSYYWTSDINGRYIGTVDPKTGLVLSQYSSDFSRNHVLCVYP